MQDARGVKRAERQFHRRQPGRAIRADLEGDDTCSALGVTVRSSSPVLALCRQLVDAGHDPTTPLEALPRQYVGPPSQINRPDCAA